MHEAVAAVLTALKDFCPLVQNITNFVVMEVNADVLLAAGASPIMAHAKEELAEMAAICDGLTINIGTLDEPWIGSMFEAGKEARARGKVVVLDPVGAGASKLRTGTAIGILEQLRPDVMRCNGSELLAVAGQSGATRGVDSTMSSNEAVNSAMLLAERYGMVCSVSGETDYVTDGKTVLSVTGGSPLMTLVTGMGCSASALTTACVAAARKAGIAGADLAGAAAAMALMAEAGENAARVSMGPGTFLPHFLDALYNALSGNSAQRVREVSLDEIQAL